MPKKNKQDLNCQTMRKLYAEDAVESFLNKLQRKFPCAKNIVPAKCEDLPYGGSFGGALKTPQTSQTNKEILQVNESRVREWKALAAHAALCWADGTIGAFQDFGRFVGINQEVGLDFLNHVRSRYNRCSAAEKGILRDAPMRTIENLLGEAQYKQSKGKCTSPIPQEIILRGLREAPPKDAAIYANESKLGPALRPSTVRGYETVRRKYRKLRNKYSPV